jgi:tRNA threonylcarbamoyladenosine biosynthesis protein TsaB
VLLLALDTCDANGSIAVLRDEAVLESSAHAAGKDYSSWLLPAVQEILDKARTELKNLDFFAVASGPGSFTGVRIGLTTVKAWAEVYRRPIAAVSRLEALATMASDQSDYVAAVTDAHRGQVFGALYQRLAGALESVGDETVLSPERFLAGAADTAGSGRIAWISTEPNCITASALWVARRDAGEAVQHFSMPLAPAIGRLGYHRLLQRRLINGLVLDANYVRRSDAEIFWKSGAKSK